MRLRILLLILLAICLSAIGAAPLAAAPMNFYAPLGNFEDPPTGSPGTGLTRLTFDPVAHTLDLNVFFSGLLGNVTASHIHVINGPGDGNPLDTNGPVATAVPTFPDFPLGETFGTYVRGFDTLAAATYNPAFVNNAGGIPQAEAALFAAIMDGRAYLNIHTSRNGGGEIRGFLEPVPEPATFGIASAALAGLLLLRRRRNQA